jgi:hypothetical protein
MFRHISRNIPGKYLKSRGEGTGSSSIDTSIPAAETLQSTIDSQTSRNRLAISPEQETYSASKILLRGSADRCVADRFGTRGPLKDTKA